MSGLKREIRNSTLAETSMHPSSLFVDAAAGVAIVYLIFRILASRKTPAPLPPGPTPKLFFGNLGDFPPPGAHEWLFWKAHKDLYGPLSCLRIPGQTVMIISDYKIALDLLEKRSGTFSDRPVFPFAGEM